ncbi:hypothetical protein [Mycobacteroides sp. LB1]|uniref:hypothetical protein n=1 Tax=Mycobacteroides sp. LB1 TaxID=2750814 RepID=UPI0015DDCEB9|nr:hypothetical protein [Mycobacteroides sp. LB1]
MPDVENDLVVASVIGTDGGEPELGTEYRFGVAALGVAVGVEVTALSSPFVCCFLGNW